MRSGNSFEIPRHWWGKILGGLLGLFKGGISGLLIGALLGHMVDRFIAGFIGVSKTQHAFFDALFACLGHLSKADGRVTPHEIQMVESLMAQMQITGDHRQRAIRLFNQGKQADFRLDEALQAAIARDKAELAGDFGGPDQGDLFAFEVQSFRLTVIQHATDFHTPFRR